METSTGQYWLSDYTTRRHAANVTGRGNGIILPEPGGHMAAIFTGQADSIVEVVRDILPAEPEPELDDWEEIAEISMIFIGPDLGCNFLDQSAPPGYEYLPPSRANPAPTGSASRSPAATATTNSPTAPSAITATPNDT